MQTPSLRAELDRLVIEAYTEWMQGHGQGLGNNMKEDDIFLESGKK